MNRSPTCQGHRCGSIHDDRHDGRPSSMIMRIEVRPRPTLVRVSQTTRSRRRDCACSSRPRPAPCGLPGGRPSRKPDPALRVGLTLDLSVPTRNPLMTLSSRGYLVSRGRLLVANDRFNSVESRCCPSAAVAVRGKSCHRPDQHSGCQAGCQRRRSRSFAEDSVGSLRRLSPPIYGTFEPARLVATRPLRCWQCGGQGFESPQLHASTPVIAGISPLVGSSTNNA